MAILQFDRQQPVVWTLLPWTPVGRALVAATRRLEEGNSPTASLDAQVILGHVLEKDRAWLFAHYDHLLTPSQAEAYANLVARRAANEPVAYLVGCREFYGLELNVDHRVLIPRPETELLVDAILNHIDSRPNKAVKMVDVGTGSGAIALAVAANAPDVQIYAIDLSADAIDVAHTNVEKLNASQQITLLQGDLLQTLPEQVDIVAANLPYINSRDFPNLMADVRDYEPRVALEAGPEGLDAIVRLLDQVPKHVRPDGVLFLEVGNDQGDAVRRLAEERLPHTRHIGVHQDHHGFDRMVVIGL